MDGERDLLLICQTYNALYLPPHPIKEDVGGKVTAAKVTTYQYKLK